MVRFCAAALFAACCAASAWTGAAEVCDGECRIPGKSPKMAAKMKSKIKYFQSKIDAMGSSGARVAQRALRRPPTSGAPCVNGFSGGFFPCKNVDLLSIVSNAQQGSKAQFGSDIWGWVDPLTSREYALTTFMDGAAIVDVTNVANPRVLFRLDTEVPATRTSYWRDVKTYKNVAYIVVDELEHGMQVFDLTRVRSAPTSGRLQVVEADLVYRQFLQAHNIFVDETTGFAYAVGGDTCRGGLHIMDLKKDPLNPEFVGCFGADGYVHDIQCVVYDGPDARFTGKEICFCYNEDTLTIIDVTDKSRVHRSNMEIKSIRILARVSYPGVKYSHQGWITADSKFLLLDDEGDEDGLRQRTETFLWNIEKLDKPRYLRSYFSPEIAIDHNLYIKGNLAYMSNYASGLRITTINGLYGGGTLEEVAFFDTFPEARSTGTYDGIWSSYIYFPSGNLALASMEYGLIMAKHNKECEDKAEVGECALLLGECSTSAEVRSKCKYSCNACSEPDPEPTCEDRVPSGFFFSSRPNKPLACSQIRSFCSRDDVAAACPVKCKACGSERIVDGPPSEPVLLRKPGSRRRRRRRSAVRP